MSIATPKQEENKQKRAKKPIFSSLKALQNKALSEKSP